MGGIFGGALATAAPGRSGADAGGASAGIGAIGGNVNATWTQRTVPQSCGGQPSSPHGGSATGAAGTDGWHGIDGAASPARSVPVSASAGTTAVGPAINAIASTARHEMPRTVFARMSPPSLGPIGPHDMKRVPEPGISRRPGGRRVTVPGDTAAT